MTTSSCRRQFVKNLELLVIHAAVGSTFNSLDRPSELWTTHSERKVSQTKTTMERQFIFKKFDSAQLPDVLRLLRLARIPMVGSFPCCAPGERLSRRRAT